ncbi:MAG: glycosyl hydrolase [Pseudomonadota bacterium]
MSLSASVAALVAGFSAMADDTPLASLPLREMGPGITGGRISDIAMMPGGNHHYLVSTASGGIWLTENNGTTWTPVFDDYGSYSVGVIEIAPSNPNIVYAGTGENNAQRSVAYGDGVYRSEDGGKSWTHVGLKDSGHISQIWVHPKDPNTVLLAAQGPLWNNGGDRGLYKTTDGGETWDLILEIDEYTGINEFVVHPDDPDRIIASSYQRRRHVWTLINGGPGSGIHLSDDGGKTWREAPGGAPSGELGRIGLAMAPSAPDTVYAIVEADDETKGVYRTTNFGTVWEKRSSFMTTSPQYYNEMVVDPQNPDRLYALDTFSSVSEDGGKTFSRLSIKARHVDDHALWIDPDNTKHMIIGGDGGVYESHDRGETWRHMDNLPLTQFYRASPDNDFPFYNVCGGTQDNNSLCGPSRTTVKHGITNSDWTLILGGDGYKPQSDPEDPNIIYTQYQYGGLARYDRRTQERVYIAPMAAEGENQYKFNWNTPLLISPHDKETIYYASAYVFKSEDRGDSWEKISPDLTRQLDRNQLEVMDRVWSVDAIAKNDSTSIYGSIIAFSESPLEAGLLFAGTDDGVISVSEDGGETWRSRQFFNGVPDMALVEDIVTSVHDPDVAYAVFDNHKKGDYAPYVFKTENRGRSWQEIGSDLPEWGSAHTIAEDHVDPDLLFVGTEYGLFFTQDGGDGWHKMTGGLPTISVRDLEVQRRENDLVIGTFGRGIYILDDYSPLRTDGDALDAEATLFPVKDAWHYIEGDRWGPSGGAQASLGDNFYYVENPDHGAVFTFHLKDGYETRRDARLAEEAEKLEAGDDTPYPSWDDLKAEDREEDPAVIAEVMNADGEVVRRIDAPSSKGLHRISWDMRHDTPDPVSLTPVERPLYGDNRGPMVSPGSYSVRLVKRIDGVEEALTEPQSFELKPLDRSPEAAEDAQAREQMHLAMRQLVVAVSSASEKASDVSERITYAKAALERAPFHDEALRNELVALTSELADVEETLYGDRTRSSRNEPSPMGLRNRAEGLRGSTWGSLSDVGGQHQEQMEIAEAQYDEVREALTGLEDRLDDIENALTDRGAPWSPGRDLPAID